MKKEKNIKGGIHGLISQLTGNIKEKIGITILPSFSSIDDQFLKEKEPILEEDTQLLKKIKKENVIPVSKEKKTSKSYPEYSERYFQKDLKEIKSRQELAKIEKQQNHKLVIKRAAYYYLAALQATDNDIVLAKNVLGFKKLKLFSSCGANSTIDILAIDMALEQLDARIAHQHGENYTYHKAR